MITPSPPAAPQPRVPSVAVSVDGRIAEDKLCIDCGYNLRGLKPEGRCPECGGAVGASLRGHELQAASLPWLRSIRRGFVLIRHAILWCLLAIVAGRLTEAAVATLAPDSPLALQIVEWAFSALLLVPILLVGYGFICATRAEPHIARRGEGRSPRRLARALTVSTLGLCGAFWLAKELMPKSSWLDYVVMYAPLVLTILAALAAAAFVQHVIALLERTAEDKTLKGARETRKYVLAAVVFATAVALIDVVVPLLGPGSDVAGRVKKAGEFISCAQSCVTIVFVIGALQLVWRVARILDRILVIAEANQLPPSTPIPKPLS